MILLATIILFINIYDGSCKLWPKGIVHYAINKKDYDLNSQDIIMTTFEKLQKEICLKFFNTPMNYSASGDNKIMYISNADRRKTCPPDDYNFEGSVVDMPIGYKCLNHREIARIVVDMLRASVGSAQTVNSYDLKKKFQEQDELSNKNLLSPTDRNFINAHYRNECGELVQNPVVSRRRGGGMMKMSSENELYYMDKLWPLGVVMFGAGEDLQSTPEYGVLKLAMIVIERVSCVVFQEIPEEDLTRFLTPKNFLWFSTHGEEIPNLGFTEGNQTIQLKSMIDGDPGHEAHTLNMLMRILGIPMMSNRFDRDNYVIVNWKNVQKGKEHYLEKTPRAAWLTNSEGEGSSYDYDSVTHAPANFMCRDCTLGAQTVQPLQDLLWQRTLSMGHRTDLSQADIDSIDLLYAQECKSRSTDE